MLIIRRLHVKTFKSRIADCILRYLIEVSVYVVGTLIFIAVAVIMEVLVTGH